MRMEKMEIKKVAMIGAGAIGSYFIEGLSEKLGENFWVVAEGERKARLTEGGIVINGKKVCLNVKTAEESRGADLLIVAVKYGALQESLNLIEKIVDSHTIVMSPLNGIDSESIIGAKIGMNHMVYSFMKIAAQRVGNEITYNPDVTAGIFFGEKDGSRSERILTIQALLNCGYGAYADSKHLAYISKRLRDEVVQVAAVKGIDISDENNSTGKNSDILPDSRFSTLQDLDAKRETEIEMFSGALIRMGKELGVETPFNEFAYHAIKCLEEKNCGKIS